MRMRKFLKLMAEDVQGLFILWEKYAYTHFFIRNLLRK